MATVIIVGDGPAGLSAALFLAKNGMEVTVFGQNSTDLHRAMLYNYLGLPEITGSEFITIARAQVRKFGAKIVEQLVINIEKAGDRFVVTTEPGEQYKSKYVVLAEGKLQKLAVKIDLPRTADGVTVDRDGHTAIDGLYAIGRSTRKSKSETIISAGAGAITALDILSLEAGKNINDFDVLPDR
ncbi:MAG: FAD-dependent oxidoreductase [Chloroflexota bacterium]